jgi:energy-coupling factor transporter ATP-binding protein EcfA2
MSDLEKRPSDKLIQFTSDLEFENDFGQQTLGIGRLTQDQGAIAVVSLAGAFVAAAAFGPLMPLVIAAVGLNDILAINKLNREREVSGESSAIDVEAVRVDEAQAPTAATLSPAPSAQPANVPNLKEVTPKANNAAPAPTSNNWINNFISQTALIWGNQGSGKSWIVRYIAKLKKDKGYRVVVLDPDSNRAEWEGVESYHDFEEIAEFLGWYVEELKGRYKAFNASNMTEDAWRAKLWADGRAIALICEEVTTYVDLIEDKELLTQFFRLGLTKSRKQEMPLTFVSHNNNQTALGGIKGLANLIEKMLQLELQTDIDPETLQPVASGKGAVKLDGSNQWVPVNLPKLERKITNFGEVQPTVMQSTTEQETNTPEDIRERLEALIKVTPKEKALPQSELAKKLIKIIQSSIKEPISFESIRKSRKWENTPPDKATLLAALEEINPDWIRGNESEGYYLQD